MENIVFDKTEEMDIFKRIFGRLLEIDTDRKSKEADLQIGIDKCLQQFNEFGFKFENNEKVLHTVTTGIENSK